MAKNVFNREKGLDVTKQPMFFGEDLQVQQYADMKYPIFDKLNQQQLGYFGDLKKYRYKKIETITYNLMNNKSLSLHQI
jgi:hypothetical protein